MSSRRSVACFIVLLVALAPGASACGGARPRPDPSRAYARIAELEARVDEGVRDARTDDRRAGAVTMSCGAADEICAIADELAEADALIRCDRARRSCTALGGGSTTASRSGE
ncbi:MAG: hypothetical protein IT379_02080 [Deltaproteobacteria bacterium]|nr:hypothetical protein [Deltaproteobacteria bacterium]